MQINLDFTDKDFMLGGVMNWLHFRGGYELH
jgi:hypothetical protein